MLAGGLPVVDLIVYVIAGYQVGRWICKAGVWLFDLYRDHVQDAPE